MPLAISMGEPAGIGPDLILQLAASAHETALPQFIVFGAPAFLSARARRLGLDLAVETLDDPRATPRPGALGVVDVSSGTDVADTPGMPDAKAASVVIRGIEAAVAAVRAVDCSAIVTAPIHKGALYDAGFAHPGHTEFLAALCAENGVTPRPVMMLAHDAYRAVPATIHVPISAVPALLTSQLVTDTVSIVAHDLSRRFGVTRPRIAVAGLNPHAGENGSIGTEDRDIITPALDALRQAGHDVVGPLPADTLFYPPHWRSYDAVVAMYHDQALIPIKTIAFEDAVNVTLGLPIIRTSPDHGTAFDLAGTGKGSVASFRAALRLAAEMSGASA